MTNAGDTLYHDLRATGVASLNKSSIPEHERLFDEICGKLNELSFKTEIPKESKTESAGFRMESNLDKNTERFDKLQTQLRRTQDDWKVAQEQIQERMKSFETFSLVQGEMSQEIRRMSEMLEQERQSNVRLSTDLAKALELNLKLQFDIEESRAKANQMVILRIPAPSSVPARRPAKHLHQQPPWVLAVLPEQCQLRYPECGFAIAR